MMTTGSGMRAYSTVRRSGENCQLRVDHNGAVALCAPHAAEYVAIVLNGVPASIEANVRLVAHRPDIDAELKKIEAAGKGRDTCVICSHGVGWRPSGRPVAMADLAEFVSGVGA